MITNICHFLDGNGEVPDLPIEAQRLLRFLSTIIEAATIAYDEPITVADVTCQNETDGETCAGLIEVWVDAENNEIGWECVECGEEGVVTHWERTRWDKRNYTCH